MPAALIEALWYVLPAYVANAAPVIFGGGRPLDGGRYWVDGRRLLGDHKTVRGLISGLSAGLITGVLQGRTLSGLLLSVGTMVGDSLGSFLKRRAGIEPGGQAPILDQEGFLLFALAFAAPIDPPEPLHALILVIVTPILHLASNAVASLLGLKGGL